MGSETEELVPQPSAFRPETLWTQEGAELAWGGLLALQPRYSGSDVQDAWVALINAHHPVWQEPVGSWLKGDPGTPGYAACGGDCWGDGNRDAPAPWPCPGVRPILNSLGVMRDGQ